MAPVIGVTSAEWTAEEIERELDTLYPDNPEERAALNRIGEMLRSLTLDLVQVEEDDSVSIDQDHQVWQCELERLDDALSGGQERAVAAVVRDITRRVGSSDWQLHIIHAGVLAHLRCYPVDPDGMPDPGWQVDILTAATKGDLYRCGDKQIAASHGEFWEDVTWQAEAMLRAGLLEWDETRLAWLRPTATGHELLDQLLPPARRSWWARVWRAVCPGWGR